ncbi:hypothetical protein DSO57_1038708 [Entomophthora muscae]|uniref:Uncharacterized protein n=1 Tax=Entomophthora muscae TaxID=34485 RepID=A0ACC2TXF1_9FUNG|nr:hypothetical protein DSO57_1038708 [Entomophthora muscae]
MRAAKPKPRTGFKPPHSAAKQKQGQPRKPAGGFDPPSIHPKSDLLQNATSRSEKFQNPAAADAAPHTVVPPTPNQSNCTDVLVSYLAAIEAAVDATNKLVDNSTSVKLQDSEILAVNNQVKFQTKDANQLFTSHQQNSPAQAKSPKFQSTLPKPLPTTSQMPVPKSWDSKSPQGLISSIFQGRPDEWYKTHFPPLKSSADNVK